MAKRDFTLWVVLALVLTGTMCVALRYRARRGLRLGLNDTAWRLTYTVEGESQDEDAQFEGESQNEGAQFRVAVPADTPHCQVFRHEVLSNLRVEPLRVLHAETPEIIADAEDQGRCELTIRFDLRLTPTAKRPFPEIPVSLSAVEKAAYVEGEEEIQVSSSVVTETLARLRTAGGIDSRSVEGLFQYCRTEIAIVDEGMPDDAEASLRRKSATLVGAARAMTALCRASGFPARLVAGFEIESNTANAAHIWVEVLVSGRWLPYDLANGFAGELPFNFLAIRRGSADIVTAEKMHDVDEEFSIVQLPHLPQEMNSGNRRPFDVLNLTRLPLAMHGVLSVILLFPLGAVVTCVFRNLIGLQTSGTFTPTLLALAFVFADWRTGIVVLVVVGVLGFATRIVLDRLQLLMVPRVSIVITLVVCCIVFAISMLDYFRLTPSVQTVLVPMVILTMIIERFYITTQEDGLTVAMQHLAGTVVVGFSCYLVLRWETVARALLTYPEAHFFTVAVLVLIGRYTGFRFLDWWRFRDAVDFEHEGR